MQLYREAEQLKNRRLRELTDNRKEAKYLSDEPLDIDEFLNTLGLYDRRYKLPNQLSEGQQQRVSIGRAIVKNPDILLCDEPTGALDAATAGEIMSLLKKQNEKGITVIIITHDDSIAKSCNRIIRIKDGEILRDV